MSAAVARPHARGTRLHVLLVPSEEYLPPESHLAGIFQHHQATALSRAGYRVGVLSIKQAYSVPMFARAALMRLAGRRVHNPLDGYSLPGIARLAAQKLAGHERFLTVEERPEAALVRAEGFYWLPPSDRTNHFGWVRAGVAAFAEYSRRYGRPDLVHAHNTHPAGLLARRLHELHGLRYVITEHSSYYARGLVPKGLYRGLRRAVRQASGFAVVSPALGRVLEAELGDCVRDAVCISNVLDADVVERPCRPVEHDGFTFLAIGSLIPLKNHAILLEAFQARCVADAGIQLRIAGDGPLETELAARIRLMGLEHRVRLLGRLDRVEILRELDACDALVLPSQYETFGVAIIEALARGKPVVASRCGGPDAIVTSDDGVLVPCNDAAALGEAMARLVREHARYASLEIRRRAIERFGPDRLVASLSDLYARALASDG